MIIQFVATSNSVSYFSDNNSKRKLRLVSKRETDAPKELLLKMMAEVEIKLDMAIITMQGMDLSVSTN